MGRATAVGPGRRAGSIPGLAAVPGAIVKSDGQSWTGGVYGPVSVARGPKRGTGTPGTFLRTDEDAWAFDPNHLRPAFSSDEPLVKPPIESTLAVGTPAGDG